MPPQVGEGSALPDEVVDQQVVTSGLDRTVERWRPRETFPSARTGVAGDVGLDYTIFDRQAIIG